MMIKIINNIEKMEAIQFAINKIKQEINSKHIEATFELKLNIDQSIKFQGYLRVREGDTITITGGDEAGIMYGILDLSCEICHRKGQKPIKFLSFSIY